MSQSDEIKIKSLTLKRGNEKILELKGDEIASFSLIPEKSVSPYWRKILDRNRDCLVHKQNYEDLNSFIKNIPHTYNENGQPIAKYEAWACVVPPKPKSLQASSVSKYKKNLTEFFETQKDKLQKFKDLNLLIYLCVYLRKERFDTDVDNLAKPILDSLKPYFGDDKKVHTLIVEKKQLYDNYDPTDLDFIENSLVIILDSMVRNDIVKI